MMMTSLINQRGIDNDGNDSRTNLAVVFIMEKFKPFIKELIRFYYED